MNVLSFFNDVVSETNKTAVFVEERCLRRRLNSCDCRQCLDSCPAEALSLDTPNIRLDTGKCSNCMLCTAVCPNDAFILPGYDFDKQFGPDPGKELSVISCSRQSQIHPEEKVVPCMGIFSPELLLVIGVTGPSVVAFNLTGCSRCENRVAADAFLYVLTYLQKHASTLLTTAFTIVTEPAQTDSLEQTDRRSFLSDLGNNLVSAAGSQLWQVMEVENAVENPTGNRRVPRKVRLIEKLLACLDDENKEIVTTLFVHQLAVNRECTLCPLCTGICPTGALKVARHNGEKLLRFKRSICSGCGLCVSFCKEKAITLSSPPVLKMLNDKAVTGILCEKQEA